MHKLLFDNNISHRVIARITDIFPSSNHVLLENLDEVGIKEFLDEPIGAILEI